MANVARCSQSSRNWPDRFSYQSLCRSMRKDTRIGRQPHYGQTKASEPECSLTKKWRLFFSALAIAPARVEHRQTPGCATRHSRNPEPKFCPGPISVELICD